MKIETGPEGLLILKEIFGNVVLETAEGNRLAVCMRDDAIEFSVPGSGRWARANLTLDPDPAKTLERITQEVMMMRRPYCSQVSIAPAEPSDAVAGPVGYGTLDEQLEESAKIEKIVQVRSVCLLCGKYIPAKTIWAATGFEVWVITKNQATKEDSETFIANFDLPKGAFDAANAMLGAGLVDRLEFTPSVPEAPAAPVTVDPHISEIVSATDGDLGEPRLGRLNAAEPTSSWVNAVSVARNITPSGADISIFFLAWEYAKQHPQLKDGGYSAGEFAYVEHVMRRLNPVVNNQNFKAFFYEAWEFAKETKDYNKNAFSNVQTWIRIAQDAGVA